MSNILVAVDEQNLHIVEAPKIAAQGVKENYVIFSFDSSWSGFSKVAYFYQEKTPDDIYESLIDGDGYALIPHEVTDQDGKICFCVAGVKDDMIYTSEILKYKIVKGLYTAGQETEPPTPGIYEQILQAMSNAPRAVNSLAEMTNTAKTYMYQNHWYYYDWGLSRWIDAGTYGGIASEEQMHDNIYEWLDDHPEATTTVQDGSLTEAKFTADLKLKAIKEYVTPQMYGAKGDGVTDDTAALNACLHANKYVFIPRGYYKISSALTTYSRDMTAVICDNKAIFIADAAFTDDYMLTFSQYVGYSHLGVSWSGGVFCCNGVSGLTALKINNYCSFGIFRDITVIDIGDNGVGIEVNIESGKNYFDNIRIFGAIFNIDITNPTANITVNRYDLTRTNTGFYSKASYDYAISNIYVMGCTVGILSEGSAQVDVGQYHYWIGSDGADNTFTYDQFVKTRAFKSIVIGDNWHFNQFYPDKPYIGAECSFISCDNTHYICVLPEMISNEDIDNLYCYLGYMTSGTGSMSFGNCDVNYSNRAEYRGVYAPMEAYRLGRVNVDNSYLPRFSYISLSNMINRYKGHVSINYDTTLSNKWLLLGYVNVNFEGVCTIEVNNSQNAVVLKADIAVKTYNGDIFNAFCYKGTSNISLYLGLGSVVRINEYDWIPIYFKMNYSGSISTMNLWVKVSGMLPFVLPADPNTRISEVSKSKYIPTEDDNYLKSYEIITENVSFFPGITTRGIAAPNIDDGYIQLTNSYLYGYVDTSNQCIIAAYRSTDNTVDVLNVSSETVTGTVHLRVLAMLDR